MKKYALIGLLIIILIVLTNFGQKMSLQREAVRVDSLKFSNTMKWNPFLVAEREDELVYKINWENIIFLPPPPTNSSKDTAGEVVVLIEYETKRTPEQIAQIKNEVSPKTTYLGGLPITDYFDSEKFPHTSLLLKDSLHDLNILTLRQKEHFDRVRPSALNARIHTAIDVPGHPAYPSGHSTQAHFLAYILGELIPDKKDTFIFEADQIAKNREIAGLHYPSDSAAGATLARQVAETFLKDKKFQSLLKEAKGEWK